MIKRFIRQACDGANLNGNWRKLDGALGTRLRRLDGGAVAAWLPEGAAVCAVIAIAYVLARLTWLAVPEPAPSVAAVPAVVAAPAPAAAGAAEIAARIASMHLFGRADAPVTANAGINAPETNLNVTLRGIIAADNPGDSWALIATGNGQGDEKSYRIGGRIPGGAVVHGIYADRVLLERDGHLEALRLPKSEAGSGSGGVTRHFTTSQTSAPPAPRPRHTAVRHPGRGRSLGALNSFIRTEPAMVNGKLTGYRVYPGSNAAAFTAAGLRPGDVIEAVNGQPLSNPRNLMKLMATKHAGSAKLTVLRNGQKTQVTVSLSH